MSFPQHGRNMDGTAAGLGGSARRARGQAMANRPRPAPGTTAGPSRDAQLAPATGQSRIPRPQGAPALQTEDGQIGVAISQPTLVPRWPLRVPLASPPTSEDSLFYRPPAGAQAPPRPPRPSRVPSMLDDSGMQGLTVVPEATSPAPFAPFHPPTSSSSVASIPNFPLPMPTAAGALPRKSVNLGPPPSARRGASSFYPTASYVSPIMEESPSRTPQSRDSFASSAAMPESWDMPSTDSSGESGKNDYTGVPPVYDRDDMYGDGNDGEEDDSQRLVRSASIGKRAKPTLVSTLSSPRDGPSAGFDQRPGIVPLQFASGTGFRDFTDSSGTPPTVARTQPQGSMPGLSQSTSGTTESSNDAPSLSSFPMLAVPPGRRAYWHLPTARRPPQLNIDAVRQAEARGSLTSLPDLIRRSIRLAASLDRGLRPASHFDLSDFPTFPPGGIVTRDREGESPRYDAEKYQSGLSNMLAAFPTSPRGRMAARDRQRESSQYDAEKHQSGLSNILAAFPTYPPRGMTARDREGESSPYDAEKHQSGLSDMLAAFPPPARTAANTPRRSFRDSFRDQISSWPILFSNNSTRSLEAPPPALANANRAGQKPGRRFGNSVQVEEPPPALANVNRVEQKPRRRCCGLPAWGFVLVLIGVLVLVAAAIVLPLEFLVIQKNKNDTTKSALAQCQHQTDCANGGTNVVNQGLCSCICTDGFTGSDCTTSDPAGCSTTSITGSSGSIKNATVGNAIGRLIEQAQANFSVVLDASTIISRFNAGNLSCSAQNALVTFDGEDTRIADALAEVFIAQSPGGYEIVGGVMVTTLTVVADPQTTYTLGGSRAGPGDISSPLAQGSTVGEWTVESTRCGASIMFATTVSFSYSTPLVTSTSTVTITITVTDEITDTLDVATIVTPTDTPTTSSTSASASAIAGTASAFIVTEEVLDFARVSVLFIVQEDNLADATTAQGTLQDFFTSAGSDSSSSSSSSSSPGVSIASAQNVTLGNNNSVDLVHFIVDSGAAIGGNSEPTTATAATTMSSSSSSSSSSVKLLRHRRLHNKHMTPAPC